MKKLAKIALILLFILVSCKKSKEYHGKLLLVGNITFPEYALQTDSIRIILDHKFMKKYKSEIGKNIRVFGELEKQKWQFADGSGERKFYYISPDSIKVEEY
jgi:hypothetical protein